MRSGFINAGAFLLVFVIIFSLQPPAPVAPSTPAGPQRGAWGAFEWWYGQRAYPHPLIPKGAWRGAFESARASRLLKERSLGTSSEPTQWRSIGPTNVGGRVLSIAVRPDAPATVFVGSASGGLWKTTTGGAGPDPWTRVETGFPALSVSAIAIDELHPDTMYIGTGEISRYVRPLIGTVGARSSYGLGVLKSTDGGSSWDTTGLSWSFQDVTAVQEIVVNPLNGSTLFAATSEGVFRSLDAGATWTLSNGELMAMDLVINPADTSILVSSHGNMNSTPNPGLYRTSNAGGTWSKIGGGLPSTNFGRTSLSICRSNPSVLYAGIANGASSSLLGLYRSNDGGLSWSLKSTTNYVGSQGWYDNVVAVHPADPATVYAGGFDIHKSTNGGASLPAVSSGAVHVDQHAIAFDPSEPSTVYFGSDGGIYKSTDGGTTFLDLNKGFLTTQFYPGLANASGDSAFAMGGLQDNGTLKYTGSPVWAQVWGGDGGWCAIDQSDKNNVYAESQYGRIVRSFSGGSSFASAASGLPGSQAEWNFIPPFVVAPSDGNVLYAGARNVYKTTNQGTSWFAANGLPTLNGTTVSAIAVSRTSADTLLAATGTGTFGATPLFQVFSSTNGGAFWSNVTGNLPDRYPTDIEIDPTDSRTAYITYSGYGTSHLFRTTNLGASWSDIGAGLPDMPHQCVAVDPVYPSYLYVGTDLGVFQSSDGGATWTPWSEGMHDAMVLDLTVSRANDALRAATFGSGVFERPLPRFPEVDLTYPAGGEILVAGLTERVRWSERYTAKVRIDFSSDGGSTWEVVADSITASDGSFDWVVPEVSTTQGRIRIANAPGGSPADTVPSSFTIVVDPDLLGGWNIVSLPVRPPDPLRTSLFPTAASNAYGYSGTYVARDSLSTGFGYWLKFELPQFSELSGEELFTDSVNLDPGWNLVGSVSAPVAVTDLIERPPGILTSPLFGYRRGYQVADSVIPGRGYWVKAGSAGTLVISSVAVPGSTLAARTGPDPEWCSLTVRDAGGFIQRLWFTSGAADGSGPDGEMPPPAPGGAPDARFASGLVARVGTGGGPGVSLFLGGLRGPVTLSWSVPRADLLFTLTGEGSPMILAPGSGSATIDAPPRVLRLDGGPAGQHGVPSEFDLAQNHPNPFNPATTVSYSLPHPSEVRLSVHDALGREVAVLVDGPRPAGTHAETWDGTGYSSGIYFCRLQAGGASAVRKMLLLK